MDSFDEEVASARHALEKAERAAHMREQAVLETRALLRELFDSTITQHLPRLISETKPYAAIEFGGSSRRGRPRFLHDAKVWVIRDHVLGVQEDGTLIKPSILSFQSHHYLKYRERIAKNIQRFNYAGVVSMHPFEYPVTSTFDDDYDRWGLYEDEIWYGTTHTKKRLITCIAEAVARG